MATATIAATVGELVGQFIYSKNLLVDRGEFSKHTIVHYRFAADFVQTHFGPTRSIAELKAIDFTRLRAAFPRSWGPERNGMVTQIIRTLFKYGYDAGLYDLPMRFGPDFTRPRRRIYRKARRERGPLLFSADEIRRMIDNTHPQLAAMICLGINCGFGNSDCGRLPFSAVNLKTGWVDFPRPKTEIDRRCPLWPETVAWIQQSTAARPEPKDPLARDCVFVTKRGRKRWADGEPKNAICVALKRLLKETGVDRRGLSFYSLRRTFETIAGETLDQPAVDLIMGHAASANDMAALYRQRIDDGRLVAVTEYVRRWLFPAPGAGKAVQQ
jgi:integrase